MLLLLSRVVHAAMSLKRLDLVPAVPTQRPEGGGGQVGYARGLGDLESAGSALRRDLGAVSLYRQGVSRHEAIY